MIFMRQALLTALMLFAACAPVFAQRPGPQFRRELACEPFEPRTKLEALETRFERVLIKGFSQIANVNVRGASIRIDAVELRDTASPTRVLGIVISMRTASDQPRESRAYVDYEEINALMKGMESVAAVNESTTKLAGFEARYRTLGDLEVVVFRQGRATGTAASMSSGICEKVTGLLTLDELETVRAYILEAKTRLDELNK